MDVNEHHLNRISLIELLNVYARAHRKKISFISINAAYTFTEIQLLRRIYSKPGSRITDLTSFLGVTKGLISNTVSKFIKMGVVRKGKNPENKKEVLIFLSELGTLHIEHINSEIEQLFVDTFSYFNDVSSECITRFNELILRSTDLIKNITEGHFS